MAGFNRELFERWLDDLRTTDAPQQRGSLHTNDAYCCLGRAVEVFDPNLWYCPYIDGVKRYYYGIEEERTYGFDLDRELQKMLGIDRMMTSGWVDTFGAFKDHGSIMEYLMALNDSGYSFRFIASVAGYLVKQALGDEYYA